MGEVVDANRMASTPYELLFRKDRQREQVCETLLDQEKLNKFRKVLAGARSWGAGAACISLERAATCRRRLPATTWRCLVWPGGPRRLVLPDVLR
jgi:hypothetical protein